MDLNYSTEELAFRDEARAWLRANLPDDLRQKMEGYEELSKDDLLRWHKILAKKGWIAPDWPEEWGGTNWNAVRRYIFEEECGYAATPPLVSFGLRLGPGLAQDARGAAGRALRRHGPEDLDHDGASRGLDLLPRPHGPQRGQ